MRVRAFLAVTSLCLLGIADLVARQAPSVIPAKITVTAPDGHFEFSQLSVTRDRLVGTVLNATSHDWFTASFAFTFYDRDGKEIKSRRPVTEDVIGIEVGRTESLDISTQGIDGRRVVRVDIRFLAESRLSPRFVIHIAKPEVRPDLSLETATVALKFAISRDEFGFSLKNKTESSVQIEWNTASFVDTEGKAHRVIRDGVKLEDRDKPQVPSVIPPGASIEARVVSVDSIEYDQLVRRVLVRPFFQVDEKTAATLKGKTFGLLLPLTTDGKTDQLFVSFIIEDVIL